MISAQENARAFRSFSTCAARASSWPACDANAHSACNSVSCSAQKPRCRVSAIWAAQGQRLGRGRASQQALFERRERLGAFQAVAEIDGIEVQRRPHLGGHRRIAGNEAPPVAATPSARAAPPIVRCGTRRCKASGTSVPSVSINSLVEANAWRASILRSAAGDAPASTDSR